MPLLTIASTMPRMSVSLTLQPKLFQLFQPMGGVSAKPLLKLAGLARLGVGALTNSVLILNTSASPTEKQFLSIRLFVMILFLLLGNGYFCTRMAQMTTDGADFF